MLLDARQRQELVNYLLGKEKQNGGSADILCIRSGAYELLTENEGIFTEIHMGDLYFCLEQRLVRVDGLDTSPGRVMYFFMIRNSILSI